MAEELWDIDDNVRRFLLWLDTEELLVRSQRTEALKAWLGVSPGSRNYGLRNLEG